MTTAKLYAPPTTVSRSEAAAPPRPWQLTSPFWPALLAGPIATGMLCYLNLRRLGAESPTPFRVTLGTTLIASLVVQTIYVALIAYPPGGALPLLFALIVCFSVSIIHYGFLQWIQSPYDQRWRSQGKPYGRMWAHGLLAWFVGRLVRKLMDGLVLAVLLVLGL